MSHPAQLLKRARQRRTPPANADMPAPAPAPVASAPPEPAAQTTPSPAPAVPSAVRRGGSHALYSEVMKRHDRAGTRHLR